MEYTPVFRPVNATVRPASRTVRFRAKPKQERTARFDRYAFLKQQFLPLIERGEGELLKSKTIEHGFYQSMVNLCGLYGWEIPQKSTQPFPFNLGEDLAKLKKLLNLSDLNASLHVLQDNVHPARLATVKYFNSGSVLFYIPVRPMLILNENYATQSVGELLLSVFAYLFKVVGISHFASEYSYLGDQYAMLKEWWLNDEEFSEDENERAEHLAFFKELKERGKLSLMMMGAMENLEKFQGRVENFKGTSIAELAFEKTAIAFLKLYRDYPERNINDTMFSPFGSEEEESTIRAEQYLHFIWDLDQIVQRQFMDCINAELNECGAIEEPTSFQYFETPQTLVTHDHDFEIRLFALLHELTDNLSDLTQ